MPVQRLVLTPGSSSGRWQYAAGRRLFSAGIGSIYVASKPRGYFLVGFCRKYRTDSTRVLIYYIIGQSHVQ